jgi:hypothetical protein
MGSVATFPKGVYRAVLRKKDHIVLYRQLLGKRRKLRILALKSLANLLELHLLHGAALFRELWQNLRTLKEPLEIPCLSIR